MYPIDTTPHKGLEPLTVGLKVQRSTDWASGATWIPLFCLFYVPSYHLTLCSITLLKEPFASTKREPIDTPPHKGLEPLTVGLKVQRSTDWASSATWIPLFSSLFSVPSYHLTLRSIIVLKEPFASTKRVSNWYYAPQGTRTLYRWIKSPTLYRLSWRGYMDTFVLLFVFCPELSFDTLLYYSVERGVCIDKKGSQLILRPTKDSNPWPLD